MKKQFSAPRSAVTSGSRPAPLSHFSFSTFQLFSFSPQPLLQKTPVTFMKKLTALSLLTLLVTLAGAPTGLAGTIHSTVTGNWGTGSTWSGGVVPLTTDDVVIESGDNVSTVGSQTCAGIAMNGGTLTIASGNTITVNGNVSGSSGTITSGANSCNFGLTGDWSFSGTVGGGSMATTYISINLNGSTLRGNVLFRNISVDSGTVTLNAAATVYHTFSVNGSSTFNPNGHLVTIGTQSGYSFSGLNSTATLIVTASTFAGNYSVNPTTIASGSTVNYNASGAQTVAALSYGNLTLSGGNTKTLGGALTLNGDLTISSSTTLATANYGVTLNGDFSNSGTFTAGSSAITLTGTGTQSIDGFTTTGLVSMTKGSGTATFTGNVNGAGLTTSGAGTLDLGAGLTHTFTGTWTRTAGTLLGDSSTLNLGNTTATSGTGTAFTAGTSTVNYNYAGAQTIAALTYNNLQTSGSGTKTLGGAIILNGGLTIGSGTTLTVSASNYGISVAGGWSNGGTFTYGTGTVTFNGSSAQSIGGSTTTTFYNVVINAGASLSLANGITFPVHALTIAGLAKASGTWGSSSSTATYKNDTYFAATSGMLSVATGSAPAPTSTVVTLTTGSNPSTYGDSLTFTATVTGTAPTTPTGTVTFKDGATTLGTGTLSGSGASATATFTTNMLSAGIHATITAVYGGDVNYATQTSGSLSQTVNARAVQLSGTRVYDGTTEAASGILTIGNIVGSDNVTLSGSATLASKNAGPQAVSTRTVTRVQSANGAVGTSAASSFTVTVTAPTSGNTLVAVISTRSTSVNAVSSISQNGATWSRVASTTGTAGTTTEIWYAPNVSGAGTTVTINLNASLFAAAVVTEYSGVLSASPVDVAATSTGSGTTAATGTTATTTQANELWIGGIGLVSSSYTLGTPINSFSSVGPATSGSVTAGNNARVYALEKIVTTTGTANSGGTISSSQWSGAIATFKTTPLALAGSAAGNYTLTGLSGSVTISAKALTVSGLSVPVSKVYDGNTTATVSGSPGSLQATETPGTGTTSDGKPYSVDSVSLTGPATGTYNSKDVASATTVTFAGLSLTGTGNGNYTITPPTQAATITPASTTTGVATSGSPKLPTDNITFTATVSDGTPVPTGTVEFKSNGSSLGSPIALDGSGQAQITVLGSAVGHGSRTITAVYANTDGNFSGSIGTLSPNQVVNTPPAVGTHSLGAVVNVDLVFARTALAALDHDADGDLLTVTGVGTTLHSLDGTTVTLNGNNITYHPGTYVGADQFTYTISDGYGGTAICTVNVTVRPGGATSVITHYLLLPNNAGFQLVAFGIPDKTYRIQASTDSGSWTDISGDIVAPSSSVIVFTDGTDPTTYTSRLYRLMRQ
jgi:hypothetical protein